MTRILALLSLIGLLTPAVAFAQPKLNRTASSTPPARMGQGQGDLATKAKDRAVQEIDRRIDALNKQLERIESMERVSATTKSSLRSQVEAQIASLESLKTKIASETSTTTLKGDIQSITKSYRIFALVMPQSAITAAVDRINTIAALMTTMSGKLAERIADSSVSDNAAAEAALADFNAKVAAAKAKAQSALSSIANLKPDNGDAATQASNKAALESARASIKEAQNLLIEARKNISTIVSTVKGQGRGSAATSSTQ